MWARRTCHFEKSGAFTGEISADMLVDLGVEYVIIGHSERRQYFAETDETVNKRTRAALAAGLKVIVCVGEMPGPAGSRASPQELVRMQTKIALGGVSGEELKNVIIAYEPVWAIGTGKTATAEQANEVCARHPQGGGGARTARQRPTAMTIQYGGSMNAGNADELTGPARCGRRPHRRRLPEGRRTLPPSSKRRQVNPTNRSCTATPRSVAKGTTMKKPLALIILDGFGDRPSEPTATPSEPPRPPTWTSSSPQ